MKDIRYYANKAGITLTDDQCVKFRAYEELLLEWNKKINLTSIILPEEIALKHFADSICVIPYIIKAFEKGKPEIRSRSIDISDFLKNSPEFSMIDIGSGAGLPGVPIKILCPGMSMTLLDSLNKRIIFQNEVIKMLGIDKCVTVHSRAEDSAGDEKYREKFDIAIARAVSGMTVLSEYCLPYVRVGGIFAAMKSNVSDELESAEYAIRLLGGEIEERHKFLLPDSDITRAVVIIRKIAKTPAAYPRKAGKPEKEPLMKPERKDV